MIKYIESEHDFDTEVLGSNDAVLVDFFATWCGPCNMLSPILEQISKEHSNIKIYKVDIDRCRDLAINYNIEFVPTMLIFKNGKEVERLGGLTEGKDILENIKKHQ